MTYWKWLVLEEQIISRESSDEITPFHHIRNLFLVLWKIAPDETLWFWWDRESEEKAYKLVEKIRSKWKMLDLIQMIDGERIARENE